MIKTIIILAILAAVALGLIFVMNFAVEVYGEYRGYDTDCNLIFCKFTKIGEEHCTVNGVPTPCSEVNRSLNYTNWRQLK